MATNDGRSWFRRLFSGSKLTPLDPTRDDLVIVASSFDDAESASAALDRANTAGMWSAGSEVVFRHHLVLPANTVDDAAAVAAQDNYSHPAEVAVRPDTPATGYRMPVENGVDVTLQRVQVIDALHVSQERSRMAGLAQRRGGIVVGWDALQPAAGPGAGAD